MTTVTVLGIIDFDGKPSAPLTRVMNKRLEQFAADLQICLEQALVDSIGCNNLAVYISYNSNYAVRWTIANHVPEGVQAVVADLCAKLGYIVWKNVDLHNFSKP